MTEVGKENRLAIFLISERASRLSVNDVGKTMAKLKNAINSQVLKDRSEYNYCNKLGEYCSLALGMLSLKDLKGSKEPEPNGKWFPHEIRPLNAMRSSGGGSMHC